MSEFNMAHLLQRFSTKVLWHFTGYGKSEADGFNILKEIVLNKKLMVSKAPSMVILPNGEKGWGHRCSCMCDIPFKDLKIHTSRYGHSGIAFHKATAIKYGHFNPVLYAHKDHFLFKQAEILLKSSVWKTSESNPEIDEYLRIIGTYTKRSDLLKDVSIGQQDEDTNQNNNFYYEREWRSSLDWNFDIKDVAALNTYGIWRHPDVT